jgi:putative heme-binding domain-containing protein
LLALARDEKSGDLRRAALSALQAFDSADIASEVLTQLPGYATDVRPAAFTLLASRPAWSLALLQAVDAGRFPKTAVPLDTVRQIKSRAEASSAVSQPSTLNSQLLTKLWPNVRQATSAELEKEITRLTEVINATTGSPYAGKKLFIESCGVCHKLFNVGAQIGPDLTIYKRDDLANMLLNVVSPNAEIREGYETFNVETKDGRNLTGFLADKDAQVVVLRGSDGQSVAVPRAEITTMNPAGLSLMPEGLLSNLSDQQVRDLFAFLRSTQPLPE